MFFFQDSTQLQFGHSSNQHGNNFIVSYYCGCVKSWGEGFSLVCSFNDMSTLNLMQEYYFPFQKIKFIIFQHEGIHKSCETCDILIYSCKMIKNRISQDFIEPTMGNFLSCQKQIQKWSARKTESVIWTSVTNPLLTVWIYFSRKMFNSKCLHISIINSTHA